MTQRSDNPELAPNTPVLVGIGVINQREADPAKADEAVELMVRAARAAGEDCGVPGLLKDVQRISVPKGVWTYANPAQRVGEAIGAPNATTLLAEIGILQQSLFADACQRINGGEIEAALVVGGEAKFRALQATIQGLEAPETQQDSAPDVHLEPEQEIWSEVESAAGLGMPVGFYALMESALRHAQGEDLESHRDRVAKLYEGMADVAKQNPHAWNRDGMAAEQIRNASPKNKMLAFPYTKYHNSQWNVDQAGALLFCSVAKAEALGIPRDKWVFPWASTESNFMVNTSQRVDLAGCPGARLAGKKALELANMTVDDIDVLELYSCFPSAVQIYAREIGISLDQQITVTGGMTFGGGPLNNYVLQSTARMAELLREQPGKKGYITSVSGMLTKQGFGVWSTEPGPNGFGFADLTAEARAEAPPLEMVKVDQGEGEIVGCTVLFQGDNPWRAVVVVTLPNGKRTIAYNENAELMNAMMTEEFVGRRVQLKDGVFSL
ncbi:acetyl-CoA C-acetyltransferase [Litorivivens lipolytica]|uniref:Acetyl-CoA C-acetyltransferase n=1 Tax=Litorivivens lipolytica TaxID=1524264 RepID=A0A7W4W6F1_9GAMM|nr:acetyl-CoA acetyltransferase [Litorivivens lipolytica]MBB3048307.1 acetyl-CoA C-acetyltransferase [Litorivivens lipolytica]